MSKSRRFLRAPLAHLAIVSAALLALAAPSSAQAQAVPKIVKKVAPEFPPEAVRRGVDRGVLKMKVTIDDKGVPTETALVEAQPPKARILSDALIESMKAWRFEGQGKPHSFEMQVVFASE